MLQESIIYLILIHLLLFFDLYSSSNIDTKFPILFEPSYKPNESLFGSSLAIIKSGSKVRFLVGAPRADALSLPTRKSGAVYICDILKHRSFCNQIKMTESKLFDEHRIRDMFMGGQILYLNQSNLLISCSHLKLSELVRENSYPTGSCNVVQISPDSIQLIDQISPLQESSLLIYRGSYYFSHAMVGFSSTLSSDETTLILGAPGFWGWRGAVVIYKTFRTSSKFFYPPTLHYLSHLHSFPDTYFGYSTGSGKFFNDNLLYIVTGAPRFNYTGAVYCFSLENSREKTFLNVISNFRIKQGEEIGEYFGSTLLVSDVNNDGLDDLIIGAPHFGSDLNQEGDSGRIYVYLSSGQDFLHPKIYTGDRLPGAQFGLSLAEAGDLNQDNYKDIIVGAPFEQENRGSVYIYFGSNMGLQESYGQKISSSFDLVYLNLFGFGLDIANGQDFDNNKYPDLLIGSFLSDKALLLRSQPSANIQSVIKIDIDHINLNNQTCIGQEKKKFSCFQITYCLKMKVKYCNSSQEMKIKLEMDTLTYEVGKNMKRGVFKYNEHYVDFIDERVFLKPNKEICSKPIEVLIDPWIQNTLTPVEFTLTPFLVTNFTNFCSQCPVFNFLKPVRKAINIETDCQSDHQCISKIFVHVSPKIINQHNTSFLIEGSQTFIDIEIVISNLADEAHLAQLILIVKPPLNLLTHSYYALKVESNQTAMTVQTFFYNQIKQGSSNFNYRFDLSNLNKKDFFDTEMLVIDAFFKTKSKLTNDSKVDDHKIIPVKRFFNVSLFSSKNQIIFYTDNLDSTKPGFNIYPKFSFLISVKKTNYSSVKSVLITIRMPAISKNGQDFLIEPKIESLSAISINCNYNWVNLDLDSITKEKKESSNSWTFNLFQNDVLFLDCKKVNCKSLICKTSSFGNNQQNASFKISSALNLTTIEKNFGKNHDIINLEMEAMFAINDNLITDTKKLKVTKIKVEFRHLLSKEQNTILIIIFSGLISFASFSFLLIVLVKIGFFERNNRKRLKQLNHQLSLETKLKSKDEKLSN